MQVLAGIDKRAHEAVATLTTRQQVLTRRCSDHVVQVLAEVDRQLAHEAVVTTHNNVLGVACLQAATNLATALQHHCSVQVLDQVGAACAALCLVSECLLTHKVYTAGPTAS